MKLMKYKLILCLVILSLFSSLVFADYDDSPPALPMELWGDATVNGNPAVNDLAIAAEVDGVDYTQESPVTFNNGLYNIMLISGDRPLTYNDDPDCIQHEANDEACIQCTLCQGANCLLGYNEATCIEGPQDGEIVSIKINTIGNMPFIDWLWGSSEEVDVVSPIGDWDISGCVNMIDFTEFADYYGQICTPMVSEICDFYDIERDYIINMIDFTVFADHYGEGC